VIIISCQSQTGGVFPQILWNRTFPDEPKTDYRNRADHAEHVIAASDSTFIVVGYTYTRSAGQCDIYCMKISGNGDLFWEARYGGPSYDEAEGGVAEGLDGYAIAGYTHSPRSNLASIWIIKIDTEGRVLWNRTYGAGSATSIVGIDDGGFIVAARRYEIWNDTRQASQYFGYPRIFRINAVGDVMWELPRSANTIIKAQDGGLVALGDGMFRFSDEGVIQWQMPIRGAYVTESGDGGYVLMYTSGDSYEGPITVVRLDRERRVVWNKTYGGELHPAAIVSSSDDGYVIAGSTGSDAFVMKIDSEGDRLWEGVYGSLGSKRADSAASVVRSSETDYIVVGSTRQVRWDLDLWVLAVRGRSPVADIPAYSLHLLALISTIALLVYGRGFIKENPPD
jgi:hypothetical protein